jgi:hypothetical protein
MKPDKLTVHDLFQRERRYTVPLYQRAYVWNKDEQWEPLWEDIERQAEACMTADTQVAKCSHFLGAIVLNVAKIVGSGVARSEVIDGQQRLTTLQILLATLRDYAAEVNSAHVARLRRLTINEDEKEGSEGSFKVWPTNADRAAYRAVMTASSIAALLKAFQVEKADALPRIGAAYAYFDEVIREFTERGGGDADTRDNRIFALIQALRTTLQLVVIELEESDDPQVIFETLNARGQPLLPSDLIRNYVFLKAANDPNLEADDLYTQYWQPFDNARLPDAVNGEDRFWHVHERQGRLTRPRIDLFMFHYLAMKTERELNIGQLFREFRDWSGASPQPVETLLADLRSYSRIFTEIMAPTGNDRVATFARRIRALDLSTVYALLLYLLSLPKEALPTPGRDQVLGDIESWLVRRMVCQLTNKNYNRFFLQLLGKMKQAAHPGLIPTVVRRELTRSKEVTLNWPDDTQFLDGWLNKPVYVKSRSDRSNMLLRAIEEASRSAKNEAITLPDSLTVEHLLPQKGTLGDYPHAETVPMEGIETPALARARLIHTIGNLTLLTQELNSSISNGPIAIKSKAIAADSDLRLNAWLRTNPLTSWSEADIAVRGKELFATARGIWGHPAGLGSPARETV